MVTKRKATQMFCAMTAITAHTCNKGIFYYMMNYQSIKGHDFIIKKGLQQ